MLQKGMRCVAALLLVAAMALVGASGLWAQKRGGTLNWFVYADPARLDWFTQTPLGVQQATAGVYSGLLQYNPDDPNEIVPDLATSYDTSNGGKTYTFHLREGVKWHDGEDFTAADVKATYDHLMDPDVQARRCGSLLRPLVDSTEVVDRHTFRIHLKFPAAPFIPSVASAWCRIAAEHILDNFDNLNSADAQIGTGPFKFKRYERGTVIEWEKNENYYNPELPYLDGVKQFILVGADRQVAAAKAGQIDVWDTWPPMSKTRAQEIKAARGEEAVIYKWPLNIIWGIHLNTTKPPFDEPDLWRAVHLAIDRKEAFQKAFEGAGVPCAILDPGLYGDWALPLDEVKKMPGCRDDKSADIAEAKRLVKKHYPNGVDFEIVTRTVGNYVDRIQLIAADLRKVGLNAKIKTYESAAGYAVYGKGDFQAIGTQDTALFVPDPSAPFSILWTKDAGRNWGKGDFPKMTRWADQALRETDDDKRRELYYKMQRYLLNNPNPTVAVGWVIGWFYKDADVRNYPRANTVYDNNTFMKVWLDR